MKNPVTDEWLRETGNPEVADYIQHLQHELLLAADTFRDFSAVLRVLGKDIMSAAADIAERHIREQLATDEPLRAKGEPA